MKRSNNTLRWLTTTAVLIALLIALQALTASAGQIVTGTCVNCVLAIAALFAGLGSGAVVAILSPFCAFLLGIGPKLLPIVPFICLGNFVFVLVLHFLIGKKHTKVWQLAVGNLSAAVAKFVVLFLGITKLLLPLMADKLMPPQVQMFNAMFSWPQLLTALLGGTLALLVVPYLRKAIKK